MKWKTGSINKYHWHKVFVWKRIQIGDYYHWLTFLKRRWTYCEDHECMCNGFWEYREIK